MSTNNPMTSRPYMAVDSNAVAYVNSAWSWATRGDVGLAEGYLRKLSSADRAHVLETCARLAATTAEIEEQAQVAAACLTPDEVRP